MRPIALLASTLAVVSASRNGTDCPDGIGQDDTLLSSSWQRLKGFASHDRHHDMIERLDKRASGQPFVKTSTQNNMCIDADGLQSGHKVQLWNCGNSQSNQQWRIEGPLFQTGGDMCLDLPNGWAYNGAKLQVWQCNGQNPNQFWSQVGSTIAFQGGPYCLDVTNGWFANGNQLQLWTCYPGSANQAFNFGSQQPAQSTSTQAAGTGTTNFYGYNCISLDQFVNKYTACKPYKDALQAAASDQGLNAVFLGSIAMIESGCNPYPSGPNGQYGPYQFMDDRAWNFYGGQGKDRTNFWDAAYGAARYFKALLAQTNGNLYNAMRLYNGQVQDGGEPEYQNWAAGYMAGTR